MSGIYGMRNFPQSSSPQPISYQSFTSLESSGSQKHILPISIKPLSQISTGVLHINLSLFKIFPCEKLQKHNQRQCVFYHNNKDKKRPNLTYSTDMCPSLEAGQQCLSDELCQFSHNRVEQLYRPEKYKTKFCSFYPNSLEKCEYGTFCSFAHCEEEIKIPLLHRILPDDDFFMFYFKTVWCPFNKAQHDKKLCVYAHNWQDYRRKPQDINYGPSLCPNWRPDVYLSRYEEGCSLGYECSKSHGWKELEYHPLNYRTKPCTSEKCKRDSFCPNYHSKLERRVISEDATNGFLVHVPRCRAELLGANGQSIQQFSKKSSSLLSVSDLAETGFSSASQIRNRECESESFEGPPYEYDYEEGLTSLSDRERKNSPKRLGIFNLITSNSYQNVSPVY